MLTDECAVREKSGERTWAATALGRVETGMGQAAQGLKGSDVLQGLKGKYDTVGYGF